MLLKKNYVILSIMTALQVFVVGASAPEVVQAPAVDWSMIGTLKYVPSLVAKIAKLPITYGISPICSFYRHSPHPKTKIASVIVALAAVKATWNYRKVRALDKKRNYEHDILGDKPDSDTKFYKWGLKEWGSARLIKQKGPEVLQWLETELRLGNIILPGLNRNAAEVVAPTWQDILQAIKAEKEEFWKDIEWLENNHVVYFDGVPSLFDAFGIKADYKNACAGAPLNEFGEKASPESPGCWTAAQEKYINEYMDNPWWDPIKNYGSSWNWINKCVAAKDYAHNIALNVYRPFFKAVKPNYSYAAQTYWKLYTSWQRLREIEKLTQKKVAGFAPVHMPVGGAQIIIQNNRA